MIDNTKAEEILQIASDYLIAVAGGGNAEELYAEAIENIKNSINGVI